MSDVIELLDAAKDAAVSDLNYPLSAAIRDLMDKHRDPPYEPEFTFEALLLIDRLSKRIHDKIRDIAWEEAVTMGAPVDAERMNAAVIELLGTDLKARLVTS